MLQPLQLQHNLKNATSMARCLIAIFCITIAPCLSASVGTTVKCLNLQINQQLQKLHSDCVHYENATAPQSVATDTQKPLLCILYLSSYQKACDKNVRIPKGELPAYNISVVCSYRDVLTDGVAEIAKLMEDRVACTGVCLDLDKGATVMPECNAAWYLNNLTRSLLRADVKPEEKQHEAQNVVSVTDKKQQAAVPETPQEKPVAAPEQVNTKGKKILIFIGIRQKLSNFIGSQHWYSLDIKQINKALTFFCRLYNTAVVRRNESYRLL